MPRGQHGLERCTRDGCAGRATKEVTLRAIQLCQKHKLRVLRREKTCERCAVRAALVAACVKRSEERRVGKECGSGKRLRAMRGTCGLRSGRRDKRGRAA